MKPEIEKLWEQYAELHGRREWALRRARELRDEAGVVGNPDREKWLVRQAQAMEREAVDAKFAADKVREKLTALIGKEARPVVAGAEIVGAVLVTTSLSTVTRSELAKCILDTGMTEVYLPEGALRVACREAGS